MSHSYQHHGKYKSERKRSRPEDCLHHANDTCVGVAHQKIANGIGECNAGNEKHDVTNYYLVSIEAEKLRGKTDAYTH